MPVTEDGGEKGEDMFAVSSYSFFFVSFDLVRSLAFH